MGTGFFGGGGGSVWSGGGGSVWSGDGGGDGSGSGGGGRTPLGYRFKDGAVVVAAPAENEVEQAVKDLLQTLRKNNKKYLLDQFTSPMVRDLYEKLFELSVDIFQNHSWDAIARKYGVADQPGCLARWSKVVTDAAAKQESYEPIRMTAKSCFEDFLFTALNNETKVYLKGRSAEVFAQMRYPVFQRASGFFLGHLIERFLKAQEESVQANAQTALRQEAFKRGDRVIRAFEKQFLGKDQVTYRQLFRVINRNPEWFIKELLA